MLVGDGIGRTVIKGYKSVADGLKTYDTGTLTVEGDGFVGKDITIQNAAGPGNDQAVAMRCNSVHAAFHRCSFEGYQDTLYAYSGIQFYKECQIYGTVDFIFSHTARVDFQDCDIYVRNPGGVKTNTITADGREVPDDINGGGLSIHHCRVLPTRELLEAGKAVTTYLGRPWKEYSRTVYMNTYMDRLVDPAGWTVWPGALPERNDHVYYAEYNNCGSGAAATNSNNRVNWKGYNRKDFDPLKFTVAQFIDGNNWLPATQVPFSPGLDQPGTGQSPCPPPPPQPTPSP